MSAFVTYLQSVRCPSTVAPGWYRTGQHVESSLVEGFYIWYSNLPAVFSERYAVMGMWDLSRLEHAVP